MNNILKKAKKSILLLLDFYLDLLYIKVRGKKMSKIIFEKLTVKEKEQVNAGNTDPVPIPEICNHTRPLLPCGMKCIDVNDNGAS